MEESKFVKADARNKDGSLYEIKKYSRKDLKKFRAHFNKITFVENMDFQNVIEKYDSEKTYFYVDPPYWKTENYYSNHDFDRNDHERLANTLKTIKGKFSLSYYDFPILKQWFPKHEYVWVMKEFAKAAAAKSGVKQNMGEELLIMNYGENDNILPSYGEQLDLFKHSFL
jgi:site-specific DNA-adenine methylase